MDFIDVSLMYFFFHHHYIHFVLSYVLIQPSSPAASTPTYMGKAHLSNYVPLLRTNLEMLMQGLSHSNLDVNFKGEQGMTLLHYAAMVG